MEFFAALLSAVFSSSKDLLSKRLAFRLDGTVSAFASFWFALPFYVVVLAVLYYLGFEAFDWSLLFLTLVFLRSLSRTTKKVACQSKSALIPKGEVADGAHCSDYLKHARQSDAALFWIPAFAGMTSCPPFDFAQDRLRRASSVRAVWETRHGPC